jgi:EmrB/QacA subfamily drug resistance transporter
MVRSGVSSPVPPSVGTVTYPSKVMTVYVLALFMTIIDGTMVNVALPTMAEDFGVATTDIEWIAVGYLLTFAAVIPAAGWLGDRFGTKRVFVAALGLFVAASLLCGLARSLDQLVAFRLLQGVGAGLVTPMGSAMLYRAYPLEERAKAAIGVLSVAVTAPAIGPMLGGIIVDTVSWHWIFLINGPIGVVAIALSVRWLTETVLADPGRFDVAGFLLSIAAVASLLYALSIAPEAGWLSATTLTFGIGGLVALVVLVVVELRIEQPILMLRLYADRLFRTVNIAATMVYAGFFGMIFVLPLYMQSLRGYSAFESGLAQSPQALGVFVVSNLFGKRLYQSIGPRRLMVVGTALTAAATCLYASAGLDTPLGVIAGFSLLRGLSVGMVFVSIQTAVYATTSMTDLGRATSLFNTGRQISYATGVALAATVIAAVVDRAGPDPDAIDRLDAYRAGFLAVGLLMVPAVFVSWFVRDDDVAVTRGLAPTSRPPEPARA